MSSSDLILSSKLLSQIQERTQQRPLFTLQSFQLNSLQSTPLIHLMASLFIHFQGSSQLPHSITHFSLHHVGKIPSNSGDCMTFSNMSLSLHSQSHCLSFFHNFTNSLCTIFLSLSIQYSHGCLAILWLQNTVLSILLLFYRKLSSISYYL